MLRDEILKQEKFVIYGAQVIAYGAYVAIRESIGKTPDCFVVTKLEGNPFEIEDIPVVTPTKIEKSTFILVAVTELIQKEVLPFLRKNGFNNIFVLNQSEEYKLMSEYYKKKQGFVFADENQNKPSNSIDFKCYEVSNHRDKTLDSHPMLKSFECAIQAGKALTDISIADIHDDTGLNISAKNRQYCEMSATYWVWKNTTHDWKGIEHYRRHIMIDPSMILDDVDVIIPLPYICYPNTMAQFRRFISQDVADALISALECVHPNEAEDYKKIIFGKYQYTYNLVCAKKEVFDAYCKWFFEITEYMETMGDKVPEIKETRALSYVAEVLTNIYFMYNRDNLRIRHVAREIYV